MQALTPLAFAPPCLPLFGHCVCFGLPPLWRHPLSHPSSVALLCHLYLVFAHCLLHSWLIPPPWQNVPVTPGPVAHPTTHADNVNKVKLFYSRIGRCAIEHVVSHPNKSNFQSLFFPFTKRIGCEMEHVYFIFLNRFQLQTSDLPVCRMECIFRTNMLRRV